jgi:hypothetical protein
MKLTHAWKSRFETGHRSIRILLATTGSRRNQRKTWWFVPSLRCGPIRGIDVAPLARRKAVFRRRREGTMNRMVRVALVASLVLAAGWAQAAPAAQPRSDNPPAVPAGASFSLFDQAGALLDHLWSRMLQIAKAPATGDDQQPIVVIDKPKAEGVGIAG